MDKQTQAAPQSFRGRLFQRDNTRRKERQILVLKTGLDGVHFSIENDEERNRLNELTPGTELQLYREPDNEYDEWAIAVYLTENDKLGYITRFKNEPIARLMDAGKKFIGIMDEPQESTKQENQQDVKRPMPRRTTENMAFPFSVYLVEMD